MGKKIYYYDDGVFEHFLTLSMLIEEFYVYISDMTSIEDDKANMSLSDYMEHFGIEVYEYNGEVYTIQSAHI